MVLMKLDDYDDEKKLVTLHQECSNASGTTICPQRISYHIPSTCQSTIIILDGLIKYFVID